jgi:ADP-heptose:LPS heptosyltransferase
MARFIPWAAARVGRLMLVAAAPLKPLLEQIDGVAECRGAGALPADSFDCWLPMMSLPLAYGLTPDKIPAAGAYLRPPAGERPVLPPTDRSHRIGICWAGSPTHGQDAHRSSRLADWRGLLELSDVQCYSLQKGEAAEAQLATLRAEHPATDLIDLAPLIQDWGDTAALLQQLDLLIAVDTGIVHLAGALGRPVWTLVYRGADWRYPQSGEAMPWYPSMRLFHQQRRDDWAPLLQRVAEALAAHDWAG